jgi:hypothetical protein
MSAANSSANNTPYGTEQELRHPTQGPFRNPDYDTERKSGFRSQSSSPLDVRKAQPHPSHILERRSPGPDAPASHNALFSPPPARAGLFHPSTSKPNSSPSLPPKPVDTIHYHPHQHEIPAESGSSHMPAR